MTNPPLTDPVALEYLTWCTTQRRESPHTVRRRRAVLRSLPGPPTALQRDQVEAWWNARAHLAEASRINELAVLRHFYRWCQIWEHRNDDPSVRITPPVKPPGNPNPVSEGDLRRVLEHLAARTEQGDGVAGPLRRAVCLGAYAGLRIAEAASVSWPDIDPVTRRARILGKGRKTRLVPFSAPLIQHLLPDTGGNVVTGRDRAWTSDYLGGLVNAAIRDAGVDATFHKLRHRYGSIGYQRVKDPKALADVMGHASVATTMGFYAKAADDAAAAIADAVVD